MCPKWRLPSQYQRRHRYPHLLLVLLLHLLRRTKTRTKKNAVTHDSSDSKWSFLFAIAYQSPSCLDPPSPTTLLHSSFFRSPHEIVTLVMFILNGLWICTTNIKFNHGYIDFLKTPNQILSCETLQLNRSHILTLKSQRSRCQGLA